MVQRQASDTWERGEPYEQYVGRWSRQVAPRFLSWLSVPAGRRWLDVGCGTGALCAAIVDHCSPSSVVGVEPSEGFLEKAKQQLAGRVVFHRGNAAEIPLDDSAVDVTVSGLVLNFVQDERAALAEIARVTGNGGTIGAYVWDYAGKMELMRLFWDAAVELNPEAVKIDEGVRFPQCRPEALAPKGRIRSNGPLALHNFADASLGNTDVFRQSVLGNAHWLKEFFQENFAWMNGLKVALTHKPISMIIYNLDVISIAVLPYET